ncbi:MAG: hybrid sensor histidine kinase/response regulator [Chloroflexi bacterium]|nr:hybrid sensor histidine kinase/response regulator [Chloroflexota bacterium]
MPESAVRNPNILVIGDRAAHLALLHTTLTAYQYAVWVETLDAPDLWSLFTFHQPDLILLDLNLPGVDGHAVCHALKSDESTRDIPVIFLSAQGSVLDKVRAFEAGGADYLSKPFDVEELVARINTQLNQQQQRQAIRTHYERERDHYATQSEIKDEVIRTAAHDLKNPLSRINLLLKMIEMHGDVNDGRGRGYLDSIQESAQNIRELIDTVLDIDRINQDADLDLSDVSINDLLYHAGQRYGVVAEAEGILLEWTLLPEDIVLQLDVRRIDQVLQNLLSNALKFTPAGGTIALFAEPTRHGGVIIHVQDSGIGIPPFDLPRIFEPFYRVRGGAHAQAEGTGFGLSIVKRIVEQHGGEVHAASREERGSCFSVTLPRLRPKSGDHTV